LIEKSKQDPETQPSNCILNNERKNACIQTQNNNIDINCTKINANQKKKSNCSSKMIQNQFESEEIDQDEEEALIGNCHFHNTVETSLVCNIPEHHKLEDMIHQDHEQISNLKYYINSLRANHELEEIAVMEKKAEIEALDLAINDRKSQLISLELAKSKKILNLSSTNSDSSSGSSTSSSTNSNNTEVSFYKEIFLRRLIKLEFRVSFENILLVKFKL
jgi:hypothetical protein